MRYELLTETKFRTGNVGGYRHLAEKLCATATSLLWRVGLLLPPPHFASFGLNFLLFAAGFGVLWGVVMWFLVWSRQGMSGGAAAGSAGVAGALFGLIMAAYYRHGARKHNLPPWSQLKTEP